MPNAYVFTFNAFFKIMKMIRLTLHYIRVHEDHYLLNKGQSASNPGFKALTFSLG
jgi:hypothetical protein